MVMPKSNDKQAFYVVQFIELPFEGIDDYVCVPYTWMLLCKKGTDRKALVAYPQNEDPLNTKNRVKRKEIRDDEWRFYMAYVKYESNDYKDAEDWVVTKNYHAALADNNSKVIEAQSRLTISEKLYNVNQSQSPKSNDDSQKSLPRISNKRPALSRPEKQLDEKRIKLSDAGQSFSTVNNDVVINIENKAIQSNSSTYNDHKLRSQDASNNMPASHHLLNSAKIAANLYNQVNKSRPLVPVSETVEKRICLMNNKRKLAIAAQNPSHLMNQSGSSAVHSDEKSASVLSQNQLKNCSQKGETYNVPQKIRQETKINNASSYNVASASRNPTSSSYKCSSFDQKLDEPMHNHQSNSQSIRMRIPSITQTPTLPANQLYQACQLPQQKQIRPNLEDSQQQPPKPKGRYSIRRKNKGQETYLQGVIKNTLPFKNILNSLRQLIETNHNDYLQGQQQLKKSQNENEPINACGADKCMTVETLSPSHTVTSDPDNKLSSDHEMTSDEAPAGATINANGNRDIMQRQKLDYVASLMNQMGSVLHSTCYMYKNLQKSIQESVKKYELLLNDVENYYKLGKSTSSASPPRNMTPEVPKATELRHPEVIASTSSRIENQQNNNISEKAPKKKHTVRRLVLPPEYDSRDTKWTLKFRAYSLGLVELMPHSGIYISYGDLKYCQYVSKNCKSLARRLLTKIFNRNALSVCSTMTEKGQASKEPGSYIRPELDEHAWTVLLNFVLEHGLQCGWKTDLEPILRILHTKIKEIRFKYGIMT